MKNKKRGKKINKNTKVKNPHTTHNSHPQQPSHQQHSSAHPAVHPSPSGRAKQQARKNTQIQNAQRENYRQNEIDRTTEKSAYIEHEHLDKIGEIALHYGFNPAKSPEIKKSDIDTAQDIIEADFIDDEEDHERLPLHVEEKVALLRMYAENNMQSRPQPVMLYFKDPFKKNPTYSAHTAHAETHIHPVAHVGYHRYADLEIIGGSKSIAEATLIHVARIILREEGYENISVDVNSIGDKDSIGRFHHDLTAYYRKNINDMHPECRQLFKKDPFALLSCNNPHCREINENAPKSLNYLSEASRNHFKETLEYLEVLGIPYRINNNLIGNRHYCTETVFTIIDGDHESKREQGSAGAGGVDGALAGKKNPDRTTHATRKILAVGVRYDGLAKKIGLKREIQGIGLSILVKGNHAELRKDVKRTRRPQASFVQLGFESKLLSLGVLELLRQASIPVYQALAKDRLGAQVTIVEKYHIPYALIMGQKEAIEKTIIVRDTTTHAQDSVLLEELVKYMKKLGV
jgi:histidyl-tRNA synthetase